MKIIVQETKAEGLESLLGKKVLLMCAVYFYTGKLVGVNENCIKLEDPSIVYNTGDWGLDRWEDAQSMRVNNHYVQVNMIESFGETSK